MNKCKLCGDYGWDMVDGVCTVCLDGHEQAQPEPAFEPIVCAYCGEPAHERYGVWINGRLTQKYYCGNECASYAQMGAEG